MHRVLEKPSAENQAEGQRRRLSLAGDVSWARIGRVEGKRRWRRGGCKNGRRGNTNMPVDGEARQHWEPCIGDIVWPWAVDENCCRVQLYLAVLSCLVSSVCLGCVSLPTLGTHSPSNPLHA